MNEFAALPTSSRTLEACSEKIAIFPTNNSRIFAALDVIQTIERDLIGKVTVEAEYFPITARLKEISGH